MATKPRGKSNTRRTTSRRKPTTIDLDVKDIKDNSSAGVKKPVKAASNANLTGTNTSPVNKSTGPTVPRSTATGAPRVKTPKTPPETPASTPNSVNKKTAGPTSAKRTAIKSSGSFGKLAAAGIVGGLITLGGAGAMQYLGMLPSLAGRDAPAPTVDLTPVLGPLEAKFAALQSKIVDLELVAAQSTNTPSVDLSAIKERIAALENAPTEVVSGEGNVSAFSGELEKLLNAQNGLTNQSATLASRLTTVEKVAESTAANQNDQVSIAAMIATAIAPLALSTKQASTKIAQMERSVATLTHKVTEDVDARINAFDKKLKNAATGEKLAKSVAINALKTAITNGQPFTAALTSLETLSGTSKALEKLKPFANSGVPTNGQLLSEFHQMQSSILASATYDPDASITDRLMTSIQSLVSISSSQALSGGSPEAIISRIDANLKADNFGAAISEWKTLPESAQQLSKEWMGKLSSRMDVDRQLFRLLDAQKSTN